MTSFIGDFPAKLDTKGRMVFPAAFMRQLGQDAADRFVVKKDIFEDCLVLYPMAEWHRQTGLIRSRTNPYNQAHNRFLRGFFRGTAEINMDASNRLLLPQRLLQVAHIDKDIILAGQDTRIEIWDKATYETLFDNEEEDFAALAQQILGQEPGQSPQT